MELKVHARKREAADHYEIRRIADGWHVRHLMIKGDCDKTGYPYLFRNLAQDSINYPHDLGGYMEWLWCKSADMSEGELQAELDKIGEWIQATEQASPSGIFSEYN
ncbi:MAG: hypothetical protein OXM01_13855 [Gemmatimonadota bacterium]|nr:hypothetical protein [Gemmatimonadota bacterium]